MKPKWRRSATSTQLKAVVRVKLATQMGKQIAEIGFLVVENQAVNILLGTKFIGDNVKTIFPRRR